MDLAPVGHLGRVPRAEGGGLVLVHREHQHALVLLRAGEQNGDGRARDVHAGVAEAKVVAALASLWLDAVHAVEDARVIARTGEGRVRARARREDRRRERERHRR